MKSEKYLKDVEALNKKADELREEMVKEGFSKEFAEKFYTKMD